MCFSVCRKKSYEVWNVVWVSVFVEAAVQNVLLFGFVIRVCVCVCVCVVVVVVVCFFHIYVCDNDLKNYEIHHNHTRNRYILLANHASNVCDCQPFSRQLWNAS